MSAEISDNKIESLDVWLMSYEDGEQQEIHLDLSTIVDRINLLKSEGYITDYSRVNLQLMSVVIP